VSDTTPLCSPLRTHSSFVVARSPAQRPAVAARARDRDAAQPRLSLTPLPVPRGDEISETLAFEVCGPTHRPFYCPDINDWDRWEHDPRRLVAQMDVALLDGTFVGTPEFPGRDTQGI